MGKTQLCVEYARQHKGDFTAVFWLDGSSKDALRQSLVDAASRLTKGDPLLGGQPVADAHEVDGTIEALQQWLSLQMNTGWLLILDNVDREWQGAVGREDPQAYDLKDYLPQADHGNVLITTRLSRLQRPRASIRLCEVDNVLGRKMLEARAGRELPGVGLLLDKLGGLPLALVQAGGYIRSPSLTVEKYIAHYDRTWDRLMAYQDRYPLQEYAERSVLTTWKMSYEQVRTVKPEAARLLDQWAFLAPSAISYDIVETYNERSEDGEDQEECEAIALDELSFQDSVGVLEQYSLVSSTVETGSLSIHTVVHSWSLYNIVDKQVRERLCMRALRMIAESIPPSSNPDDLQAARRLIPHARMAATRYSKMGEMTGIEQELHEIATFMQDWESSQEVETLFLGALRGKEEAWGAKHTSTLETVNNLGAFYADQGKMKEAEEMYLRALRGFEEAWGAKHTSTLETVKNLGLLYKNQARAYNILEMKSRLRICFQISTGQYDSHKQVLASVVQLCSRYAFRNTSLLGKLGRMLLWAGDTENAQIAFENQITKTGAVWSHGGTYCDGCGVTLTIDTGRLICKACSDVDLCEACHRNYDVLDTIDGASIGCTGHQLLAVSQTDLYSAMSSRNEKLFAWTRQILQRYPVASEHEPGWAVNEH